MNKSYLAFTGKLNQERFSANLTLNWCSAAYLKLTIGKCMIKTFRGGGVVDGVGGSSERCLKWGGGWGRG